MGALRVSARVSHPLPAAAPHRRPLRLCQGAHARTLGRIHHKQWQPDVPAGMLLPACYRAGMRLQCKNVK